MAERVLAAHGRAYDALNAIMNETASPAYLLQRGSRTFLANAKAAKLRQRAQLDTLRKWVASPPPGIAVTELRDTDGAALSLVVVNRSSPKAEVDSFARNLGLTTAQARVLHHVVDGQANATIAARLNITERTVEAHLTAIYSKASVPSRTALVALFVRCSDSR
jgi:DNA-binding NarL/FixJ family response regulator